MKVCTFLFVGLLLVSGFDTYAASKHRNQLYQQAESFRIGTKGKKDANKAQKLYAQSCKKGYARACWRQALMLDFPQLLFTKKSNTKVLRNLQKKLYRRSCRLRLADGCAAIASYADKINNAARQKRRMIRLYKRACRMGSGVACYKQFVFKKQTWKAKKKKTLRLQQAWWKVRKKQLKKIEKRLKQGCNRGIETDCFLLAYLNFQGELEKGRMFASKMFTKGCHLGHANSCDFYALMSGAGLGIPKNLKQARIYHEKACLLGLAEGCTHQAGLIFRGLGGSSHLAKARQLFKKACQWNESQGCLLWGEMMIRGEGGKRHLRQTLSCFQKSCLLKNAEGCKRYKALKPIIDANRKLKAKKAQKR